MGGMEEGEEETRCNAADPYSRPSTLFGAVQPVGLLRADGHQWHGGGLEP